MRRILSAPGSALLILLAACNQRPATDLKAEETAIRELEAAWSTAANAKQLETCLSFYADDGLSLHPGALPASTNEARRKIWIDMLALPALSIAWQVSKVDVSSSGDLAYVYGPYQMSYNDPKGNQIKDRGKYVDVWKKRPDGKWTCVADTFNTDLAQ